MFLINNKSFFSCFSGLLSAGIKVKHFEDERRQVITQVRNVLLHVHGCLSPQIATF